MKQQINLYQAVLIDRKATLHAGTMFQTLVGCFVLLLMTSSFLVWQQATLDKEVARLTQERATVVANLQAIRAQHPPSPNNILLAQSLKKKQGELVERRPLLAYLGNSNLTQTTGFSAVIKGFAQYPLQGVWLTGIRLNNEEQKVLLAGSAIQPELIPTYLQHLGDKNVLKNQMFASLKVTHMKETSRQVDFRLESDFRITDE